ncbi:NB-ARC domain-containing protein [Streptomyces sp. MB09-01]|uniref:NB-ARC domain-containing protein n=1 Tax=Streptomyces sp. MB09-01 TaxID=3028666 RepID=UPI0029A89E2F|nr:NB-ARC domain-containing protein [Streptomyces sp. MB09-01]MDX3536846.1 NB-ARC domain-containing protein [Streptomyces sp. MB09-01]
MHAVQGSLAAYRVDHVTYQAAPRGAISWPHQVGLIPRRATAFQDRAEAVRLRGSGASAGTTAQVLAGMGGVGKTQLAADHARHAWENGKVDLLVWVTAASRQAVVDAYAQAAADILHADPSDPERAARAFLAWLEPKSTQQAPRWLIVLDDVADPGDLRGLWPPAHALGRTLITTRRRDAALTAHGRPVPVGLFTPAEAIAYLQQALAAHGGRGSTTEALADLAEDLGHLPLALSQAAAYLVDTHLDAADYRTRLADRARQLADLLPEPGTLPDDQPTTVAAAWLLSLERADQLRPAGLARPMLQLVAMLDPNGIPHEVLTSAPALAHLTAHRATQAGDSCAQESPAVSAEEATGALRALHRLSLVDHTPEAPHQGVRVHQLVQRSMLDSLAPDRRDQLARTAGDALTAVWPEIEREPVLAQALRANTETLAGHAGYALYRPHVHAVLYRKGNSLGDTGQVTAARNHYHRLAATTGHQLGPDHPDTLLARGRFAWWRGEAGDAAGAVATLTDLIADLLRVLGPDHPDTLMTRGRLARWQAEAGDAVGAVATLTDLVDDYLRLLGPDHPATLATCQALALQQGGAGKGGDFGVR